MNIRLFTLCDGAYNYNGKLTVVGTTDNIKVGRFPATVNIGIAVKVSFPPQEYGTKVMKIQIQDSGNMNVLQEIVLPSTDAKSKEGEEARLALAGNIQGLNFDREGWYVVRLFINDDEYTLPFRVMR